MPIVARGDEVAGTLAMMGLVVSIELDDTPGPSGVAPARNAVNQLLLFRASATPIKPSATRINSQTNCRRNPAVDAPVDCVVGGADVVGNPAVRLACSRARRLPEAWVRRTLARCTALLGLLFSGNLDRFATLGHHSVY